MSTQQAAVFLFDLALIIVLARLFGAVVQRCGQPAVIGEVVAGVLVGPTLFDGAIAGILFPGDIQPFLTALANLGMALFMFLVGLELEPATLRGSGRVAVTVSITSIVLPFGLGTALASYLADHHAHADRLGFILFMGVAMSVTAFPLLARILTDWGMHRTPLGGLSLTCAAIGDVLAWALLAVVVMVSSTDGGHLWRLLLLPLYLAVMLWLVRPLLHRVIVTRSAGRLTIGVLTAVLAGLLLSAGLTEWLGLHFIFGAFLFGVIMPRTGARQVRDSIVTGVGQISGTLLLPVFFVVAGLNVDLGQLDRAGLAELALILLVAVIGKFAGVFLSARAHGLDARQSGVLAALLNTRGLTELVMLNIGRQLDLLDRDLYSLTVVMAVLTTAMTGPLLSVLHPHRQSDRASALALDAVTHPTPGAHTQGMYQCADPEHAHAYGSTPRTRADSVP
ncbi:Sodium/hydrogen exchanger [Carbonactinospora thermoautotrophica]|uniref:Sodium/hydrogen exchanger n=1 Tax=Carbonactinospora thermoautotrophica TaxID=1469144 RepID=A0A132MSY3_9ACTN|nr:cation:proton antiporter [Carbonactinospora thermoautotrophica]KWX00846.1 Sodium/hydrogen exchanger [Carbonactinospora thermoautotrophica]